MVIKKIDFSTFNIEADENLKKYMNRKIGKLDKYIARRLRDSVYVEVQLREIKSFHKNKCQCEVSFTLPGEKIVVSESTLNIYAAIDIVEEKMKHQLIKYKQLHSSSKLYRHLSSRHNRHFMTSLEND